MKFFTGIMKIIIDIVAILMVILLLAVLVNYFQIAVYNNKFSNLFGYTFFEVTTGSMSKTIQIDDVIIVKITKEVKTGDIISFFNEDEIVTHRIIEEKNRQLITKGDANNTTDKPITKEEVIGKVELIIPKFGIWIRVFSDYRVSLSIIITILLFGLALNSGKKKNRHTFSKFIKNVKEYRKNAKERETKD